VNDSLQLSHDVPTWHRSRWLFLRLLGVVYLIAFASLAVQIMGLVGAHGLFPAGTYLESARSVYGRGAWRLLPTVFWLSTSDVALRLVAWGGVALAIVVVLGLAQRVVFVLLWILYLSLTVVGQDFLSFQWDALLLETGLLAVLWAPSGWLPGRDAAPPSALARWLLVFLLFKLMFLSGATKLLSGDSTWRHLTALDFHFETQPLPTWPGWYAHQQPPLLHRIGTAGMFAIELGAPWLLFAPTRLRRLRYAGVAALALLQASIALTGNYGFFNLLAVVLCIPVLDDGVLRRLVPIRPIGAPAPMAGRHPIIGAVAPVVFIFSALSFWAEIAYTLPAGRGAALLPGWAAGLLRVVAPLRSFNGYGLFRVMTVERPEVMVEGSRDGRQWKEYEFRYKPGSVTRRPEFVEPHHPRLDWQMWFVALDPMSGLPLLRALTEHLRAGTPEVLALLSRNPFPGTPPSHIRFALYDYRFTTPEERSRTGAWWHRDLVAYLPELQ
jgi:hypothetical protein